MAKKEKRIHRGIVAVLLSFVFILEGGVPIFAVDTSYDGWPNSYPNYSCDKYFSPNSGKIYATFYPTYIITEVSCTYDASRVSYITNWNKYGYTDGVNTYVHAYAGIDIKNVPDKAKAEQLNARRITSTLPNPKFDLENDLFSDSNNYQEEAEVVALGTIQAGVRYNTTVEWDDYRDGQIELGHWNVNSELSAKGVQDYNVISGQSESLVFLYYHANKGEK